MPDIEDFREHLQACVDARQLGDLFPLTEIMGEHWEGVPSNERVKLGTQFGQQVENRSFKNIVFDGIYRAGRQNRYKRI